MKKLFKRLALTAVVALSVLSCGPLNKVKNDKDQNLGTVMVMSYVMENATMHQVDSICVVDELPYLNDWAVSYFRDYETNEVIARRVYVKEANGKEAVYVVTGMSEPYNVSRRITK